MCKKHLKINELLNGPTSTYWILNIYTYWIFSLDSTMKIYSEAMSSKIRTLFDLIVKIWFDFIFIIVYFILILALWFALFIRWIWLWIYMVFSPIFWLFIFFWKGWEWFNEKFSLKELVALSMVPVYVSWALAFWLLFISIIWSWLESSPNVNLIKISPLQNWASELKILGTYTFTYDWDFASSSNIEATNSVNQLFSTALWPIWMVILDLFWLIVLRMWVMAALNSSKITANITAPIRSFWESTWKLLMNAPKYMPLPFTKGQTMQWMANVWNTIESVVRQSAISKSNELGQAIWWAISNAIWLPNSDFARELTNQNSRLKEISTLIKNQNFSRSWQLIVNAISELAKASWSKNLNEFLLNKNAWNEAVKTIW
jgi:hypothetical protein